MRNIINISLPRELAQSAREETKRGQYASVSEFFRHLLRVHKMAKELEGAKKDFSAKKGWKVLQSLKDLK